MEFDRLEDSPAGFPSLPPDTISRLAKRAFERLSFTFTRPHLDHLLGIARDDGASDNDRLVASYLLENAVISSRGTLPLCQDTGTAQVFAWKDEGILTGGDDTSAIAGGALDAWRASALRNSTTLPEGFFGERDPGDNGPAQTALFATVPAPGAGRAYRFLFCAKGGGSSNKTTLTQATKALLEPSAFSAFLREKIAALGTAACPPYVISVVAGGISPEQNLLALKLATAGYFDAPAPGFDYRVMGTVPERDSVLEREVLSIAAETGLGAQFGGRALATAARVLRLPRHGASLPVSVGVSCVAHRNLLGRIDSDGVWLERTVADPASVPGLAEAAARCSAPRPGAVRIDTTEGVESIRARLAGLAPGTPVLVSGPLLVARDAAHARWRGIIRAGHDLPDYVARYPIMYAGPAGTPEGRVIGSFGPTTAGRMDEYAEELMSRGAALVTLAKGNRSETWRSACASFGAVYLGTPGGIAALIAERHVTESRVLDYPELGMEAVRLVTVRDMPAFVVINGRGEDFFARRKGEDNGSHQHRRGS